MENISWILLMVGLVVGALSGYWISKSGTKSDAEETYTAKQQREKTENLEKIRVYISNKDEVSNDEIEKHFGLANATTERYLDELEKQGHLKQVGKTGSAVTYKVL